MQPTKDSCLTLCRHPMRGRVILVAHLDRGDRIRIIVPGGQLEKRRMSTGKSVRKRSDELRKEYDFSALGRGVRGKYYRRATSGTNLVLIDPDLVRAFPTGRAVNDALRMLVDVASATPAAKRRSRRRAV